MPKPWEVEQPFEEKKGTKPWEVDHPELGDEREDEPGIIETIGEFAKPPVIGALGEKLGQAGAAGIEQVVEAFGGEGAIPGRQTFGEAYGALGEQALARRQEMAKQRPLTAGIAEGVGGLTIPGAGAGMAGLRGLLTRIGSEMGLSGAEAAVRDRDVLEEAGTTGAVQAGFEALPLVGKAVRPVTELAGRGLGKVGDVMALYGGVRPWGKDVQGTREAMRRALVADPELKRRARDVDLQQEALGVGEKLEEAYPKLTGALGEKYQKAKEASMATGVAEDVNQMDRSFKVIEDLTDIVKKRPKFFKHTPEVLERVDDILKGEGPPRLRQGKTYDEIVSDINEAAMAGDQLEVGKGVSMLKERIVAARRQIDAADLKFENLTPDERELYGEVRTSLNQVLDNMSKTDSLRNADRMWRTFRTLEEGAIYPVSKGKEGFKKTRLIKPESVATKAISNAAGAKAWNKRMDKFEEFVKGEDLPKEAVQPFNDYLKAFDEFREVREMSKDLVLLEQSAGGPTSKAVSGALMVTNPWLLLGLPILNPSAYIQAKEVFQGMGRKEVTDTIDNFWNKLPTQKAQRLATSLMRDEERRTPEQTLMDRIRNSNMNIGFPGGI